MRAQFTVGLALALLFAPACSVIVGSDPIRCELGRTDPCPDGLRCLGDFCAPPCDLDGDGFGCGGTMDCADDDAAIYPTATETCDGVDSDCDGVEDAPCPTGEQCQRRGPGEAYRCLSMGDCLVGNTICTDMQRCDSATGQCVARTATDCRSTGCPMTQECDTLTGSCFMPKAVGEPCVRNLECATDICFPAASLEPGAVGGVCSRPCCSDEDCADVAGACRASGTGVRGCVQPLAAAPACTHDNECSGTCRLDASRTFSCSATLLDGLRAGGACMSDMDCYSRYCFESVCVEPCESGADCVEQGEACRYRNTSTLLAPTWVTVCAAPEGPVANGEVCSADRDCQEKYCRTEQTGRRCSGACCSDAHCDPGFVCRPVEHFGWELRCIRP
jgi:hypothetical protein